MRVRFSLVQALGATALAMTSTSAQAPDTLMLEYAVKIICGVPNRPALAPGMYYTAINVHNPSRDSVRVAQRFATTLGGEQPGPVSPTTFAPRVLLPDEALEIDCTDISRRAKIAGFAKGFALIRSPVQLDVVAVYTAAIAQGRPIQTMELQRVPPRSTAGCSLSDLTVESIARPVLEQGRSRIDAVIRNLGPGDAPASVARVIDPSTTTSTGAPQNAIANTPALPAGTATTVTFFLPYWVFNPDATLDVEADYKDTVRECREDNNVKHYEARG